MVQDNDNELDAIRVYIKDNPLKWAEDEENPENIKVINGGRGKRRPYLQNND